MFIFAAIGLACKFHNLKSTNSYFSLYSEYIKSFTFDSVNDFLNDDQYDDLPILILPSRAN